MQQCVPPQCQPLLLSRQECPKTQAQTSSPTMMHGGVASHQLDSVTTWVLRLSRDGHVGSSLGLLLSVRVRCVRRGVRLVRDGRGSQPGAACGQRTISATHRVTAPPHGVSQPGHLTLVGICTSGPGLRTLIKTRYRVYLTICACVLRRARACSQHEFGVQTRIQERD